MRKHSSTMRHWYSDSGWALMKDWTSRVPAAGTYHERLNTDADRYGGSNVRLAHGEVPAEPIAAHGRAWSIALTLPPLAALFLEWEP